nr:TonB-dependent receptor [Rhizomicrobium palustre]
METVVVSGVRDTLASAQTVKAQSQAIVDAVVGLDIGKLPDNQAVEALSRLPGIQVNYSENEARSPSVRGLPNLMTTFNGREIFTTDGRGTHLQDFPAGALAGIEVYKSVTADLIDPGIAGLINVRLRRPLDFDGFALKGNLQFSLSEQTGRVDPVGSLLLSDRWSTGVGDMGLLVNFAIVRSSWLTSDRWASSSYSPLNSNGTNVTTTGISPTINMPNQVGVYYGRGSRTRPFFNGAYQWRPSDNFEVYVEALWQGYRGQNSDDWAGDNLMDTDNGRDFSGSSLSASQKYWKNCSDAGTCIVNRHATLSNIVLDARDPNRVGSLVKAGGVPLQTYRSTTNDRGDTLQAAFGFKWTAGIAEVTSDFAWTDSRYDSMSYSVDGQTADPVRMSINFNADGGEGFALNGFDGLNPDNWIWRGYYESKSFYAGDGLQGRTDVKLTPGWNVIDEIDFGVRATTHHASANSIDRYAWLADLAMVGKGIPLASTPVGSLQKVTDAFRDDGAQIFQNWLAPTREAIRTRHGDMRAAALAALQLKAQLGIGGDNFASDIANWSKASVEYDPNRGYGADEYTYGGYAQAHYNLKSLIGLDVDGTVGLRIVNTDDKTFGALTLTDAKGNTTITPTTMASNYTYLLPSFGARWKIDDAFVLRAAATRTFTRPGYSDMSPTTTVTIVDASNSNSTYNASISTGNPNLRPLTATNYDTSLDYYFSDVGYLSVALFWHDLKGFFSNYTQILKNYPTYGTVQISRPENAGDGAVKGVELSGQTVFDFLPGWMSHLGLSGNVTFLDAQNQMPQALGVNSQMVQLTGISKWAYSLTGFYEDGPYGVRMAYNWRSQYVNSYNRNANEQQYAGELVRARGRLDFSTYYNVTEKLNLSLEVSNLLAEPFESYRYMNQTSYYPRDVRDEGRYLSLGLRFSY